MSNTSYILNQKIKNIRSFIDNNSDIEEQVSLRSDLQANDFNIEGATVVQSQFVETNSINEKEEKEEDCNNSLNICSNVYMD